MNESARLDADTSQVYSTIFFPEMRIFRAIPPPCCGSALTLYNDEPFV
jgi:hypothetical protein